jgi:hypothetical protein
MTEPWANLENKFVAKIIEQYNAWQAFFKEDTTNEERLEILSKKIVPQHRWFSEYSNKVHANVGEREKNEDSLHIATRALVDLEYITGEKSGGRKRRLRLTKRRRCHGSGRAFTRSKL